MAQIKTYARLKPSKKPYNGYEIKKNVLTVHIPDIVVSSQQPLRSNMSYDITFTDIFRPAASQENVFDGVAKGIIQSFLNGYNGTIFAYGQTGTGKTYTVEGNTASFNTRGLSTRALSMIYQQLENRTDDHITVCLSYLEIYQEVAYDLLNPISRSSLPLVPFAKVTVVEGPRGSCIFRGLSLHLAANEEIAQMLLLQGQANRKVAETPVNQRSSRSHAVFTVYLQVRKHNSDVLLNSKLHLVDLAGSERVSKTGVDGQQLTEAKSINLSLHHLETVIIALQSERSVSTTSSGGGGGGEKNRAEYPTSQSRSNTSFMSGPLSDNGTKHYKFVPYRNSLLTMVLKDSLGGNCLTAMIATISMEPENLGESISTCRFAQRVAHIANNARRNEEVDDKTVIKRLRHKVANLEHQLAILKAKVIKRKQAGRNDLAITNEDIMSVLSEDDRSACAKIMDGFLQGLIDDPVDAGIYDQSRFRECLQLLKQQYLNSSNCQLHANLQLQPTQRIAVTDHPSDGNHQMQPNNPHRDSGDHAMSEATQADSSVFISQQRPTFCCPSMINTHDEYVILNSDQGVKETGTITESDRKFAEMKGNESGQLLDTCGCEMHCSLGERQRIKELKKQGHKMTSLDYVVKQEQLTQISHDILMQELQAAENNLRLKLQKVDEQVMQQRTFLLQMKQNQADVVQIARAQLVEQQLKKRQSKYYEKLRKLLENKAKLKSAISPDLSSLVCGASNNKHSIEEKFVPTKQGKACQTCLSYDETELSAKMDREKFVSKTKPQDTKESSLMPDKTRDVKQKYRLAQQQPEPLYALSVVQYANKPDKCPVQASVSIDSNRSDRVHEPLYNFNNCDLDESHNEEAKNDHTKMHTSRTSSRTTLQSKERSFSEIYHHVSEPMAKHFQDYMAAGYNERLDEDNDGRVVKGNNIIKPNEASKRLENGSNYNLRNGLAPYQEGSSAPSIMRPGVVNDDASREENEDVLNESPTINGLLPNEVRSFHDPHHSHKFALDDVPRESGSFCNTKTDISNYSENKNNSYFALIQNCKETAFSSINHNTNAISDIIEESGTDTETDPPMESQMQPSSTLDCGMSSNNSVQKPTGCDSVQEAVHDIKADTEFQITGVQIKNTTTGHKEDYKKVDIFNVADTEFDVQLKDTTTEHREDYVNVDSINVADTEFDVQIKDKTTEHRENYEKVDIVNVADTEFDVLLKDTTTEHREDYEKVGTINVADTEFDVQIKDKTEHREDYEIVDIMADQSEEELTETFLNNILLNSSLTFTPSSASDISLSLLDFSSQLQPVSVQDVSSQTIESELFHAPVLKAQKHTKVLPAEVSSFQGSSSLSNLATQHKSKSHPFTSPRISIPEVGYNRRFKTLSDNASTSRPEIDSTSACNLLTDSTTVWKTITDCGEACSSHTSVNDFSAGGEHQSLQSPMYSIPFCDKVSGDSGEIKHIDTDIYQHELYPCDTKIGQFTLDEQVDEDDDFKFDESKYDGNYDDDLLEANTFFGLYPADVKLKALTSEERERTYMLTVAAENARVDKIRKIKRAAEIIQDCWMAYRAEK